MLSNNPPDMAQLSDEVAQSISEWLKENPVVETEEQAREAKKQLDRAKLCVKDMEDERVKKVNPLNEEVKKINDYYRKPRDIIQKIGQEISSRLTIFVKKEQEKRELEAMEAARLAAEAEEKARAAEQAEKEALASASQGELGIDVKQVTEQADQAFDEFKKANRQATLAERNANVKIGGGFTRAIGLRKQTVLEIVDYVAIIKATGLTKHIEEGILKAARGYHTLYGEYPPGIKSHEERKIS